MAVKVALAAIESARIGKPIDIATFEEPPLVATNKASAIQVTVVSDEQVDRLVNYIKGLSDFEFVNSIDGQYNHMGATLTDAVLQAGVNYTTVVKPRVQHILQHYPEARTTSGFLALLNRETPEKLLNWQPGRKPNTLRQLTELLATKGLEGEADIRLWLQAETNRAILRELHGIGSKTIDYLQILVGDQGVAVDRHIYNFLANAGITNVNYEQAHHFVSEAARLLDVPLATLDHSIWRYMSKSKETPRSGVQ